MEESKDENWKKRDIMNPETFKKWDCEQKYLKKLVKEVDDFSWSVKDKTLKYIAGFDISFSRDNENIACSYLVILRYPGFKRVYEDHEIIELESEYIPGFLAFREIPHYLKLFEKLKKKSPEFLPQIILMDGNGILHQNECGVASHLGVVLDIPTIGCGKTVFYKDGITAVNKLKPSLIIQDFVKDQSDRLLKKQGETFKLVGKSGRVWGAVLKSGEPDEEPIIVSVGHKVSLDSALEIVKVCCKYRIPEPVRQADSLSRKIIKNVDDTSKLAPVKNKMVYLSSTVKK